MLIPLGTPGSVCIGPSSLFGCITYIWHKAKLSLKPELFKEKFNCFGYVIKFPNIDHLWCQAKSICVIPNLLAGGHMALVGCDFIPQWWVADPSQVLQNLFFHLDEVCDHIVRQAWPNPPNRLNHLWEQRKTKEGAFKSQTKCYCITKCTVYGKNKVPSKSGMVPVWGSEGAAGSHMVSCLRLQRSPSNRPPDSAGKDHAPRCPASNTPVLHALQAPAALLQRWLKINKIHKLWDHRCCETFICDCSVNMVKAQFHLWPPDGVHLLRCHWSPAFSSLDWSGSPRFCDTKPLPRSSTLLPTLWTILDRLFFGTYQQHGLYSRISHLLSKDSLLSNHKNFGYQPDTHWRPHSTVKSSLYLWSSHFPRHPCNAVETFAACISVLFQSPQSNLWSKPWIQGIVTEIWAAQKEMGNVIQQYSAIGIKWRCKF